MTQSVPEPQDRKLLPYGLQWHEIGFLVLLGVALYATDSKFWLQRWPVWLFTAALIAAVPVLIFRCREEWQHVPNRWFFFSLLGTWVALFVFWGNVPLSYFDTGSLPDWMFGQYTSTSTDDGHGVLIPFVVLGLYWWKRKELVAQPLGIWWPALSIIVVALMFHFVGFVAQQQRLSVVAFLLGIYGLTGLAWGWHWLKSSFFPYFLLVFCIPVSEFADPLTLPLRLLVSRIVEIIAHLGLAPDLIREGNRLRDSQNQFAYDVAPACSGIHSLVALIALMTIYGFVVFKPAWKRLAMMLVAVPLAMLGNVVRLCFTIGVAEMFGQNAGKAIETKLGFLTFAFAVVCAFLFAQRLEKIGTEPVEADKPAAGQILNNKPATP